MFNMTDILLPIFDLLRKYDPEYVEKFIKENPHLKDVALGNRMLGDDDDIQKQDRRSNMEKVFEIADKISNSVKLNIEDIKHTIEQKTKKTSRIRFCISVLTSFSTAILISATIKNQETMELMSAVIAFLGSTFISINTYFDSITGGEGRINRAKEELVLIVDQYAEAKSFYYIAEALEKEDKAIECLKLFGKVSTRCSATSHSLGIKLK